MLGEFDSDSEDEEITKPTQKIKKTKKEIKSKR